MLSSKLFNINNKYLVESKLIYNTVVRYRSNNLNLKKNRNQYLDRMANINKKVALINAKCSQGQVT